MTVRRPPPPFGADWKGWANQLHRYLVDEQSGPPARRPVILQHLTPDSVASVDGMLLWDNENKRVVVSRDGAFRALGEEP